MPKNNLVFALVQKLDDTQIIVTIPQMSKRAYIVKGATDSNPYGTVGKVIDYIANDGVKSFNRNISITVGTVTSGHIDLTKMQMIVIKD